MVTYPLTDCRYAILNYRVLSPVGSCTLAQFSTLVYAFENLESVDLLSQVFYHQLIYRHFADCGIGNIT